jgi:hypothetical protein
VNYMTTDFYDDYLPIRRNSMSWVWRNGVLLIPLAMIDPSIAIPYLHNIPSSGL